MALLVAFVAVFALALSTASPAKASHTYEESCSIRTNPFPNAQTNATKDGSFVAAGGELFCHEGNLFYADNHVTEMYIHVTLQVQSAVTGLWYNRDDGSARWTGTIGNSPPIVRANVSDVCANTLVRNHRVRFNDVWYKTGDGAIHQVSQGSYGGTVSVACGN